MGGRGEGLCLQAGGSATLMLLKRPVRWRVVKEASKAREENGARGAEGKAQVNSGHKVNEAYILDNKRALLHRKMGPHGT